jgi:hypothetical protein
MRSLHSVWAAGAFAASLAAQGIVLPTHFRIAEGNGFSNEGIGATTPVRHLQIHDAVAARTVRSLAFRRDAATFNAAVLPAGVVLCDLSVSTSTTNASMPNPVFDQNHGNDRVAVLTATPVQFPATSPGPIVRPFVFKLPFTTPFNFGGQGAFCWDLRISTRSNLQAMPMDACNNWDANPGALLWNYGTGCKASGQSQVMSLAGGSAPDWLNLRLTISYQGANLPPSSTAFLCIGVSSENWGPLPLPFLLPGTGSAPSGPCSVTNDHLLLVPTPTTASGTLSASFPIPVNVAHNGVNLFTQALAQDQNANSWGVVLSNSVQHHILTPYTTVPVAEVYGLSTATSGTTRSYQGAIVLLE